MKNNFRIFSICILLFFLGAKQITAQSITIENDYLLQNLILSVDGGFTYGFTDYKSSSLGPVVRASIEYYPLIIRNARLGLKVFGGGLAINFSDSRNLISSNDGLREIPKEIVTDAIQIGAGLSFGYAFGDHLIPSITVGGSYLNFSPKDSDGKVRPFNKQEVYDKSIIVFTLEGELKIKLTERISISTLLSYYPTSTDYLEDVSAATNNDTYLTGMVGLSYAFDGNFDADEDGVSNKNDLCPNTPIGVKVDQFGCPIDSDSDGIADYLDKCINTPLNVVVDSNGCPFDTDMDGVPDYLDKCSETPENLVVDAMGCPADSDKDGVPDYIDKCDNTPQGIEIDEFGCPNDSDKDGVPDYLDKCPDTPTNLKVDSSGCSIEDIDKETFYQFNLRGDDTFAGSSYNLNDAVKLILNEIAFYIQNQLGSKWRIEGHMDSQGAVYSIKKLSYERARAVYDYLVVQGVSADQLEVYGLGDSFPIDNNNTIEGRSANRRIIIIRED